MAKSKTSKGSDSNVVKLSQKLSISNAAELVDELSKQLNTGEEITLDMSDVEQVDTSAIQVLVGFVNSADKAGSDYKWRGESEALNNFSKALALNTNLNFDSGAIPEAELCPVF